MLPELLSRLGFAARRRAPSFFKRDAAAIEEPPQRADAEVAAELPLKPLLQFGQRHVGVPRDLVQDEGGMRLDALRLAVAALLVRPHVTRGFGPHRPADRTRGADPKPL